MIPENLWKRVTSTPGKDGGRVALLSAVVDGQRVWCEKHWGAPHLESGERKLLHERFWTSDPNKVHSTAEMALAHAQQPIEPNQP